MSKIRVGCVPYLNSTPLIFGIENVRFSEPSQLAVLLERDEFDVTLLSSVQYLRNKRHLEFVPGISIASAGRIGSVRLYVRKDIRDVKTVALDENSISSNAIAKLVIENKYELLPEYVSYDPKRQKFSEVEADACVVIGDRAFKYSDSPHLDVGREWFEMTGLPCVFALWVMKKNHPLRDKMKFLLNSGLEIGIASIDKIAEAESPKRALPVEFIKSYLRNIVFRMNDECVKGLSRLDELIQKK